MIYIGDMVIDNSGIPEISDFTYEKEYVEDYTRNQPIVTRVDNATFTCDVKINKIMLLKVSGIWDWVIDNCSNRRVVHLIKHGRNNRVKMKNWNRAVRIIGKILEQGGIRNARKL